MKMVLAMQRSTDDTGMAPSGAISEPYTHKGRRVGRPAAISFSHTSLIDSPGISSLLGNGENAISRARWRHELRYVDAIRGGGRNGLALVGARQHRPDVE